MGTISLDRNVRRTYNSITKSVESTVGQCAHLHTRILERG